MSAQGCPPSVAINFATVAEVFMPDALGLATISNAGGLVPLSSTIQVHDAPAPAGSKSTLVYPNEIILTRPNNNVSFFICVFFFKFRKNKIKL